jgi:hypothetical protein
MLQKNRHTLKQPPLGLTVNGQSGQEVTNHRNKQGNKSTDNEADQPDVSDTADASADLFAYAVKNV